MNPYDKLVIRVKNRPTYNGQPLKPFAATLEGREFQVEVLWQCDDDERYSGEFALRPVDEAESRRWYENGIAWIASGDVEIVAALGDRGRE